MYKPMLIPLTLWIVFVSMPECRAAEQAFVMKQVTYGPEYGVFCCEAELKAKNDVATLVIKVASDEKDFVLDRFHTSHPASISSATAADVATISVKFVATDPNVVGVTYMLPIKDTHSFRHAIELASGELNGYVRINDSSKSNAVWKSTPLAIRRGALELTETINMGAGESIVLPVASLAKYKLQITEIVDQYRLSGGQVRGLLSIKNLGQRRLPAGPVRVLNNGTLKFVTTLSENLEPGSTTELLTRPVSESLLATKPGVAAEQWYEAVSLDAGILSYKARPVMLIELTNRSNRNVVIANDSSSAIELAVGETTTIPHPTGPVIDQLRVANLLDLLPATLNQHVVELDKLFKIGRKDAITDKLRSIQSKFKLLQDAYAGRAKLNESKAVLEARLKEFHDNRSYPETLRVLASRLEQTDAEMKVRQRRIDEVTSEIVALLFD